MKSRTPTRRARTADPINAAAKKAIESLETRRLMAVSMGSDGFTVVTPSSDTKTIYVSSSNGSDTNDGSSADKAVKSITKGVSLLRNGYPDHLLLKKGDTFTSGFGGWNKSGRNSQEPMLISSYGSGTARPYLKTGTGAGFQSSKAFHDVAIIGLSFEAHTRNPDSPDFQGSAGKYGLHTVGAVNGLLVENSSFSHYVYNASITGFDGYAKNVKIRRSAFTDSWTNNDKAVGFYSSNTEGMLLEENLFDHNGWNESSKAVGGMAHPSHNVYLWESTRDPVIRGNIFARGGQHGLQARGGGTIEDNLFLKNPIALLVGNGSTVRPGGVTAKVTGNVFLDSRDMNGSPRGWAIELGNIKSAYVGDNIIANDTQLKHTAITLQTDTSATNASQGVGINDLTIEKNIIYDWYQGISIATGYVIGGSGQTGLNDLVVRDNDFQKTASSRIVYHPKAYNSAEETWENNDYHNNLSSGSWFYLNGGTTSFDSWKSKVESSADNAQQKYPDPERDIAKYSASVGAGASLAGFVDEVRDQQKGNWRKAFTAKSAISYIRAGFTGVTPDGPTPEPEPTPEPTPNPTPTPEPEPTPNPTPTPPPPAPEPEPTDSDTTPPKVLSHKFDAAAKTITVKFSEDVGRSLNTGDLRLRSLADNSMITYSHMTMSYDVGTHTATWKINKDIPVATHKVLITWATVTDAAGNYLDGNGDGTPTPDYVWYLSPSDLETAPADSTGGTDSGTGGGTDDGTGNDGGTDDGGTDVIIDDGGTDAAPPSVLWSTFDPAERTVIVKFSKDVGRSLNTGDLRLRSLNDSSMITYANMTLSYDAATHTATWKINKEIPAMDYKLLITWATVNDAAGNNLDGNGDGTVGPDYAVYIRASDIAANNAITTPKTAAA